MLYMFHSLGLRLRYSIEIGRANKSKLKAVASSKNVHLHSLESSQKPTSGLLSPLIQYTLVLCNNLDLDLPRGSPKKPT